ncbi:SgcJ/EcaC family oxidoreductase [Hydrogenophaga sp.]|uniref:YybH family protein n=1 Tax=Hydrogenophaga sp. TaxID=1904254 RepID=UPI0025C5A4C8|nr:SgcJ/EcaC family oxidoreductase [Hydrogenophaga sp.]MDP2165474.1 SgcJ/EcaC family oxidoreductase [Hydrogenophaga sp.]MDP3475076.1 SgcJ/EcaC family oxidoreductase [Hydrogenophaga sp.]
MNGSTEARALMDQWCKAFVAADVEGVLSLYASDAVFLGTSSPRMVSTSQQVRTYFVGAMHERKPQSAQVLELQHQDFGNMAVITALDRIEWSAAAGPAVSMGRVTVLLQRVADAWQIVNFHRSEVPRV